MVHDTHKEDYWVETIRHFIRVHVKLRHRLFNLAGEEDDGELNKPDLETC